MSDEGSALEPEQLVTALDRQESEQPTLPPDEVLERRAAAAVEREPVDEEEVRGARLGAGASEEMSAGNKQDR